MKQCVMPLVIKSLLIVFFVLNFKYLFDNKAAVMKKFEDNFEMANLLYLQMKQKKLLDFKGKSGVEKEVLVNHYIMIGVSLLLLFIVRLKIVGLLLPMFYFVQKVILLDVRAMLIGLDKNIINSILCLVVESILLFGCFVYLLENNNKRCKRIRN